ncbi:MAG: DUF4194 domain-containing protein [Oceanospirillaceae bacterium]|nr:DUF4194 domain-containing protein [Oceanospirillaceae bacterium]
MLTDNIQAAAQRRGLSIETFRKIILRLLGRQVIYRLKSQRDRELFDAFLMLRESVTDYLDVMGIRLAVNEQGGFVIAYPPGSSVPGIEEEALVDQGAEIQRRLKAEEKGLLLALRMIFEDTLRAGTLTDEGLAMAELSAVYTRYQQIVGREMASNVTEREKSFDQLKRMSIIHECGDIQDSESLLSITPIVEYLSLSSVTSALSQVEAGEPLILEQAAPESLEQENILSSEEDANVPG